MYGEKCGKCSLSRKRERARVRVVQIDEMHFNAAFDIESARRYFLRRELVRKRKACHSCVGRNLAAFVDQQKTLDSCPRLKHSRAGSTQERQLIICRAFVI